MRKQLKTKSTKVDPKKAAPLIERAIAASKRAAGKTHPKKKESHE